MSSRFSETFPLTPWRSSSHPLLREVLELEFGVSDMELELEAGSGCLSLQEEQTSRIRSLMATEQSPLLEAICRCLEEHGQPSGSELLPSFEDSAIQNLTKILCLDPQQAKEKVFLLSLYGLMLRECSDAAVVKRYLTRLLDMSHQSCSQREGIAFAVGLASASHLEVVWAMLEHLGRTRFLRSALRDTQESDPDLRWKWVSSTALLCYGQMATHAKEQILPWVDNIVSRMVYYFSSSSCDETLKSSFLSAASMLTKTLQQEYNTQNYRFTQIPELVQCLLCILQKEPNFLASPFRPKIILVVLGLSKLRPHLKPLVKARVLQVCFSSVFKLPPMPTETPEGCPALMQLDPSAKVLYKETMCALSLLLRTFVTENSSMDEVCFLLQHTEPWLMSDKSHERQRAVQSILLFLQYLVDTVKFTEEATPSVLGHQIGLLTLLWRDEDKMTCRYSYQCVYLLLQLTVQQKGKTQEAVYPNKLKQRESWSPRDWEAKLYSMAKAFEQDLTVAQHTHLVLTLLNSLCSHNHLRCDLASKLLLMMFEEAGLKAEQVAEVLHSLFQELPDIPLQDVQQTVLKAMTTLGSQHPQETVEVVLSLCHPSERRTLPLWKALAADCRLARRVITLLYVKLRLRPPWDMTRSSCQTQLISLLALGTIYELLYTQEFRSTIRWAFAGMLLGLLTQLHYLFELGAVEGMADYQEDMLDSKPLGPCRTCLEALKGLFWTSNYWEVFASIQLLRGWELLEQLDTYADGVILLARAMVQHDCEVKAVLGQAVISLKSVEERDNVVAILLLTEFLNSPEVFQYASRKKLDNLLSQGLGNCNQLVRAMSLKGLSSAAMHPKKVSLLRNRMAGLLDSFLRPGSKDLTGLMAVLHDILQCLGLQGVVSVSLKLAQHLLSLFENEQEEVRGGAILLFGDVISSCSQKTRHAFKNLAFQAVVPLLLHLVDPCPQVALKCKSTFLRCAVLLKWEFRKELFGKLAWGHGLGAENDVFVYVVESNFGKYHQFLLQALTYLGSPHRPLKLAAMKFIGALLQDYLTELCFYLRKGDLSIVKKYFEPLREDRDLACRRFYRNFLEDVTELARNVP
ncbi:maestro heat-like repeat family member 5 isoform X2 [Ochotona princeps]|uniref:maestro heat-like repeat family member 5 isoform X2 n=1 Tax=Ochotona princeps TaxID=9978 RepID=UPI00271469E8|nr:maestro heat-like repeat family member 5 isoform X2 [Ochotona princeps]